MSDVSARIKRNIDTLTESQRRLAEYVVSNREMAAFLSTEALGTWNARVAAGEPVEEVAADAARQLLDLADPGETEGLASPRPVRSP